MCLEGGFANANTLAVKSLSDQFQRHFFHDWGVNKLDRFVYNLKKCMLKDQFGEHQSVIR